MGLGRLLRRASIRRDTGRVFLTDLIDREIVKPRKPLDLDDIWSAALKLWNLIKRGSYDRKQLWEAFHDLQDAVYAPPLRSDRVFHPSSLFSDCPRMLHYEMAGVEYSDANRKRVNAQLQRTFDVGTWWHTYIQSALHRAGVMEQAEFPIRNRKRRLLGSGDGKLCFVPGFPKGAPRFLLEVKTINSRGYVKIQTGPYDYHLHQASIYAHEAGIEWIYFIYINKDTSEMKEHLVPVDAESVKEAHEKISFVLASVKKDSPPKRICSSNISKSALECGFCTHCFNDSRNA